MDRALYVEKLYDHTTRQRSTVGSIMEVIMIEQYPVGTKFITFDQILEWNLWPDFIKIFRKLYSAILICMH